jgi:hypothetical protein
MYLVLVVLHWFNGVLFVPGTCTGTGLKVFWLYWFDDVLVVGTG